jgi:hypothetical protein
MPIGLGSNASHQPTTLLPARPAAALQTELLYSSAAALQLLIEADQATWCDAHFCQFTHAIVRLMCHTH